MSGQERDHRKIKMFSRGRIPEKYEKCSTNTGMSVRISPELVFDLFRNWCSRLTGIYIVDPVTYRISRKIPTRIGAIDFAPFILMIIIVFLQRFLIRSLFDLGTRMN